MLAGVLLLGFAASWVLQNLPQWPQPLTLVGVALLLVGVAWAARIKPQHALVPEAQL